MPHLKRTKRGEAKGYDVPGGAKHFRGEYEK
jgi:hypothetical protein